MTALASGVLLAGGDSGSGSPIGLFVILALCVAVYFLWKSLNRHLKRIPESFDSNAESAAPDGAESAGPDSDPAHSADES